MTTIVDVSITGPDADWLAKHARDLVGRRLAACGNIIPSIRSIYRWHGSIEDDIESYLVLHTQSSHVPAIIEFTNSVHPNDVVQILATEVSQADDGYASWVIEETSLATPGS